MRRPLRLARLKQLNKDKAVSRPKGANGAVGEAERLQPRLLQRARNPHR
jgi:hypothetical protein